MKRLFIAILLAACAPAFAFTCLPFPLGGTTMTAAADSWGRSWGWNCPVTYQDGAVKWRQESFVVLHGYSLRYDLMASPVAAGVLAAASPLLAANTALDLLSKAPQPGPETDSYNRLHKDAQTRAFAVAPAAIPAKPKGLFVAPNGTAKTRQCYLFANGARVSKTGAGSVSVGLPCKPEVAQVVENGVTYAAFGPWFRADRVTVCEAK